MRWTRWLKKRTEELQFAELIGTCHLLRVHHQIKVDQAVVELNKRVKLVALIALLIALIFY